MTLDCAASYKYVHTISSVGGMSLLLSRYIARRSYRLMSSKRTPTRIRPRQENCKSSCMLISTAERCTFLESYGVESPSSVRSQCNILPKNHRLIRRLLNGLEYKLGSDGAQRMLMCCLDCSTLRQSRTRRITGRHDEPRLFSEPVSIVSKTCLYCRST